MNGQDTITLKPELQAKMNAAVIDRIRASVDGSKDRDEIMRSYRDMVDGITYAMTQPPWQGACQLDDPIILEHCLSLAAHIKANIRNEPYWLVQATDPQNDEAANKAEQWLTVRARHWKVHQRLFDIIWNAVRFPFAMGYVGWKQESTKIRLTAYRDDETGDIVDEDQKDQYKTYTPTPVARYKVTYEGPDVRSISPLDFYLDPPNARSVDEADGVIERMWFSRGDLLAGIQKLGYDDTAVKQMMGRQSAPVLNSGVRTDNDEQDGVKSEADGIYECFMYTGRMPIIVGSDGELETPDYLLDEDFVWLTCPALNVTIRFTASQDDERAYGAFYIFRDGDRFMGKCVPQILESIAMEATANLRFKFDMCDLAVCPTRKVPKSIYGQLTGFQKSPGLTIPYPDHLGPNSIMEEPLQLGGVEALAQNSAELRMRANELMSAQGTDNVQPQEPPTATQVNVVNQNAVGKRDLLTQTFLEGFEWMGGRLLKQSVDHFDSVDPSASFFGETVTLSKDDLAKDFRLLCNVNTDASNPQLRIQKLLAETQVVRQSPIYQMKVARGDMTMEYPLLLRFLEESGERNPTALLGPKPNAMDSSAILQMVLQGAQQAAQGGDPFAQQTIQMVQQMMDQAIGGGQGGPPQMGGQQGQQPQGKSPAEMINYKDAPPDIRRQMEQQAGLQPSQVGDPPPQPPAPRRAA